MPPRSIASTTCQVSLKTLGAMIGQVRSERLIAIEQHEPLMVLLVLML